MATAATAIALHGFRVEVLASSSDCKIVGRPAKKRIYFETGEYAAINYSGTGSHSDPAVSIVRAYQALFDSLPGGSNPEMTVTMEYMCENAVITDVDITVVPQGPGTTPTRAGPTFNPSTGKYDTTISGTSAYGGQTVIIATYTYEGKEC